MTPDEVMQAIMAAQCSDEGSSDCEHWSAFVRGAWRLVHQFDQGGRRYLIAEPRPGSEALSPLDWQMLGARARGAALKVIAADFGLSEATVSRRLRKAMAELGLRTQSDLARLLASAFEPPAPGAQRGPVE